MQKKVKTQLANKKNRVEVELLDLEIIIWKFDQ